MEAVIFTILATLLVSTISFVGVLILMKKIKPDNPLIIALILFAAGSLLGDVLLHLFPEYFAKYGYSQTGAIAIFAGITIMLIVEAYFHCSHDSKDELEHKNNKIIAKVNLVGDALHNFLDGVAIGVSFLISPIVGFSTTIAVVLHEIPQELADSSVLVYSGMRRKKILLVNFVTGLIAIFGGLVALLLNNLIENISFILIPLAAGQFIYIALSDLLPEIHKKSGVTKYIIEISMFVIGFMIMAALALFD